VLVGEYPYGMLLSGISGEIPRARKGKLQDEEHAHWREDEEYQL